MQDHIQSMSDTASRRQDQAPGSRAAALEVIARALVPFALGHFEDQERQPGGQWVHPPLTPNDRAYQAAEAVQKALEAAGYVVDEHSIYTATAKVPTPITMPRATDWRRG